MALLTALVSSSSKDIPPLQMKGLLPLQVEVTSVLFVEMQVESRGGRTRSRDVDY